MKIDRDNAYGLVPHVRAYIRGPKKTDEADPELSADRVKAV
jgi:hypothetical protein